MHNKFLIFCIILIICAAAVLYSSQSLSSDEFVNKLVTSEVAENEVMIFYVEQNSFAIKTDMQKIIWIDPYFPDKSKNPSMFVNKNELVNPEKIPADYVFCTHAHMDHTHLPTVSAINKANRNAVFIAPKESYPLLKKAQIPDKRIKTVKLNDELSFPGFTVRAVYAEPTDEEKITHLGFIFTINDIKIYDSGDTKVGLDKYLDKMQYIIGEKPDIAIICINEGYHNLGPKDAAYLAFMINPEMFIPMHYNCFTNNSIDPESVLPYLPEKLKIKYNIMNRNSSITYKK